jgi:hypothetical protein
MRVRPPYSAQQRHGITPHFRENAMNETKTWIFGVAAGLLMTMGLITALNSYVTRIQTFAERPVVHFEPVTVTADRPRAPSTLADTKSKQPASL